MNYYIFLYAFSISSSLLSALLLWYQHKHKSGFFFLISMICASVWFAAYFAFFSGWFQETVLLFISRFAYFIGIVWVYSFLLFVCLFWKKVTLKKAYTLLVAVWLFLLSYLYMGTSWIVESLDFSITENVYREVPGKWIWIHAGLYFIFLCLFIIVSYRQIARQTHLNKIRLKNIVLIGIIFIAILVFLQLVLPSFWIWIFEKDIILLYVVFVFATIANIKRYYFPRFGYGFGKMLIYIASLIVAIGCIAFLKEMYARIDGSLSYFWQFQDYYGILDAILTIVVFYGAYKVFLQFLPGSFDLEKLRFMIEVMEKEIPYFMNIDELNTYIEKQFSKILWTNKAHIRLFQNTSTPQYLVKFLSQSNDKIFINDIVFLEERCFKYDSVKLVRENGKDICMSFPIQWDENNVIIGIFSLGFKSLGDFYTIQEIRLLRAFVAFLESHIKYLQSYQKLQNLSQVLDKKVDEKTIEYNDLINKQKEFISTISHEIKSPIAWAILQTDSILDDINGESDIPAIKKEMELLNIQLVRVGDLIGKLFSLQYYDTHSVTLFKENVQIQNLLNMEIDIYETMHPHVEFIRNIDSKMRFIEIDKIQFQQVLTNLLNNATKFSNNDSPKIYIEAKVEWNVFFLSVEDNGAGFSGIDIENIFEKYTIGKSWAVGLWIGLYLCKHIIGMHGGTISAQYGQYLKWARIDITIPLD